MRREMLLLSALGLALAQSCGEEFLDGDWYPCTNDGCTELDHEGVRFDPDGRFAILDAPGSSYEPGEVPEVSGAVGRYALREGRVTLQATIEGQTATAEGAFEGEYLIVTIQGKVEICAAGGPTSAPPDDGGCTTRVDTQTVRLKRVGDGGPIPSTGSVPTAGPDGRQPTPIPPPSPSPDDGNVQPR